MFSHFKTFVLSFFLIIAGVVLIGAQETAKPEAEKKDKPETAKPEKTPKPAREEKPKAAAKVDLKNPTAEQVAETVLIVYGGYGGRETLKQIRKTAIERGKLSIANADGVTEQVTYEKRILRGDNLEKERIRFDQESPSTKYSLIYNDNKIVGVFNDAIFTPREDASKAFQNQIWHGIDALLRYKENDAKVTLDKREKYMGVEYFTLDLTDKENRKTRYFVSAKSFRVMWLEYSEDGTKFVRRFYDYRNAQGTLVPYRSVLLANNKQIEETTISTVSYGQKVEEDIFKAS